MKDRAIILMILIFFALSGCALSLSDAVKMEGEAGEGAGGSGSINISELLKIPPDPKNRLERHLPLPDGSTQKFGPVSYIIKYMELKLGTVSKDIYTKLNAGGSVANLLKAVFTLFLVIYVISINLGIVKASSYDVAINLIKFSLISLMSLNWAEFSLIVKDTLELGGKELTNIMATSFSKSTTNFNFADDVVSVVLSMNMMKFLYALFNPTTGSGWMFGIFMVIFIWNFAKALLKALYIFLVSMIIRAVLFGLAPIFLASVMFKATRPLFDGWVKQLVNFTILPVILFTFLGFFYEIITVFIQMLSQTALNSMPIPVSYDTTSKMPGNLFSIFMLIFGTPGNKITGVDGQIPIDLFPVIALAVISYVMLQMTEWAISISGSITQAFSSFTGPALDPGTPGNTLGTQLSNVTKDETAAKQQAARPNVGGP